MIQPLDDSLDFLIRDTRRLLLKCIELRLAQDGIPLGAWFPLRILYEEDGITQRQLSRKLGYLDAAAGAIVEVMEKLKLVRRVRNTEDRRKINVFLTPLGRRMGNARSDTCKRSTTRSRSASPNGTPTRCAPCCSAPTPTLRFSRLIAVFEAAIDRQEQVHQTAAVGG